MSSAQAAPSRREEREKTKTHVATQGQPGSTGTNTGTVQLWTFYPELYWIAAASLDKFALLTLSILLHIKDFLFCQKQKNSKEFICYKTVDVAVSI